MYFEPPLRVCTRHSVRTSFQTTRTPARVATARKMRVGFTGNHIANSTQTTCGSAPLTAFFVWGDVTDFKHFLPRISELAVERGHAFEDTSVVFNKLHLAFDDPPVLFRDDAEERWVRKHGQRT
jgi:hypothetical protein